MISTTDKHRYARMKEAGAINFQGASNSDKAVVIVRYDEKSVAICVSKESDGDMISGAGQADCQTIAGSTAKSGV